MKYRLKIIQHYGHKGLKAKPYIVEGTTLPNAWQRLWGKKSETSRFVSELGIVWYKQLDDGSVRKCDVWTNRMLETFVRERNMERRLSECSIDE